MAASFIGCVRATCTAEPSPVIAAISEKNSPNTDAMTMLLRANSSSRLRSRYHALMPTTTTADST